MICIKPIAPAVETAQGRNADSCLMTARIKLAGTEFFCAAKLVSFSTSSSARAGHAEVGTRTFGISTTAGAGSQRAEKKLSENELLEVLNAG